MPAHTGLTVLYQLPKQKQKTLKVTKLTSCTNFRMIQATIKYFERSTVESIVENSNDVSHPGVPLFVYAIIHIKNEGQKVDK